MHTFQICICYIQHLIMRLSTLILVIYFTFSFGCNVSLMLLEHLKPHKLF